MQALPYDDAIAPPPIGLTLTEVFRFGAEFQQWMLSRHWLKNLPLGDGHGIITVPGFGGADGCMSAVRSTLNNLGYDAQPWRLGRNIPTGKMGSMEDAVAYRDERVAQLEQRVIELSARTGGKVSLVGWSFGGIFADRLGMLRPDLVRQVITLGTPFGDTRGTAVHHVMSRMGGNHEEVTTEEMGVWVDNSPRPVPTTVIYSERDGIVSKDSARLNDVDNVDHVQIRSSHVGFAVNPRALWLVANRLSQPEGAEKVLHETDIPWYVRAI